MKQVLIVIPTFNEAGNIMPLYCAIDDVFSKQTIKGTYSYDILFVDDNSPDGTSDVIKKLQPKHKNINILSGPKEGLGKAYIRGLTYGLNLNNYYAILTMDADLSHGPNYIPDLLSTLENGYDYVIGSRYVHRGGNDNGYSIFRRFISNVANLLARRYLRKNRNISNHKLAISSDNTELRDLTSGFKVMRVDKIKTIPLDKLNVSGYVFQVVLTYEFIKRGYRATEIPITFHVRERGTSKFGVKDIAEFLKIVARL